MSADKIVAGPPSATTADLEMPDLKPKYKSWRKKYRKLKCNFDEGIRESNSMFREEQKLSALARRIQEQNDQLLDLLLDLNSTVNIPPELRYNLNLDPAPPPPNPQAQYEQANRQVNEAAALMHNGQLAAGDFIHLRATVEARLAEQDAQPLSSIESHLPHPEPTDSPTKAGPTEPNPYLGMLDTTHETDYLLRLDVSLGDPWSLSRPPPPTLFPDLKNFSERDWEREAQLHNPISVHNWLRKHHPAAFSSTNADADAVSDAGQATPHGRGRGAGGGRKKNLAQKLGDKAVAAAREHEEEGRDTPASELPKTEQELLDEEIGYAEPDAGGSGRKKARDADETYRPKGGRSGRGKRKREDGDVASGKGKKARTSGGVGVGGGVEAFTL
ncbi:hypothetical protein LTR50_001598 [Elasticomyces elasticus]|nr:hypothetical protein LTR50_001598 [Elasticomyces elasticus]